MSPPQRAAPGHPITFGEEASWLHLVHRFHFHKCYNRKMCQIQATAIPSTSSSARCQGEYITTGGLSLRAHSSRRQPGFQHLPGSSSARAKGPRAPVYSSGASRIIASSQLLSRLFQVLLVFKKHTNSTRIQILFMHEL